ncbi:MAG: NAD(P)-dependent oxidoreductase [Candidatus Brocadia sp.]|nr:NAD(P)-dependent oxidoreductase [Candidatus Brocadia sp.]
MHILITGSAGFIGGYLSKALMNEGHTITGLDICSNEQQASVCNFIMGDIRDKSTLRHAMKGVNLIIHLAAKLEDFGIPRKEFFAINEGGTKNILDVASESDVKRFIFYSSVAVYGPGEAVESGKLLPIDDYGRTKLASEKTIKAWADEDNSRMALAIRPTVVFGAHNYANVYRLMDAVVKRKFIWIGDGSNIKSLAYVENLVAMNLFLLNRMKPGFDVFNYSDEPYMTTRQIVEKIATYAHVPIPRRKIPLFISQLGGMAMDIASNLTGVDLPMRRVRIRKFCAQTYYKSDKIRQCGFKQPVLLDEGLEKTVMWYLQMREKNDTTNVTNALSHTSPCRQNKAILPD